MEHKALAALMVRLVGLWELVVAVNSLPNAIGPFFNPEYVHKAGLFVLLGSALFAVALPLGVGLFLIYFPRSIVSGALRIEGSELNPDEARRLERVGMSLMGLWLTVDAVTSATYNFSRWHLYRRFIEDQYTGATGPTIGPSEFAGLLTNALQLILGLWLLLGTRGLLGAFERLRR
jgi:hypothetical protein